MPPTRFEPSLIKNREKREEIHRSRKKAKGQEKLKRRLALAEAERKNPSLKQARVAENIPRTLENTREFNPSVVPVAGPPAHNSGGEPGSSSVNQGDQENTLDITNDVFADHFKPPNPTEHDHDSVPKVLITTSQKATKVTFQFCEELVSVFPGAEFIRRKRGHGFEMGRIANWAGNRGYGAMVVVNEDSKKPNAMTIIRLPHGPTAYFKLTSIQTSAEITGHARPDPYYPELVLNGFVTRLGLTVGRLFQTLFPVMPEFRGRQVVTLHNQRDFLFFRRHRYAFKSTEKTALQEIGPRFTLKLRSLKKDIPAVQVDSNPPPPLEFANDDSLDESQPLGSTEETEESGKSCDTQPSKTHRLDNADDFEWVWKPELETTRRTFFL